MILAFPDTIPYCTSVVPAEAGTHAFVQGWTPACADSTPRLTQKGLGGSDGGVTAKPLFLPHVALRVYCPHAPGRGMTGIA